MQIAAARGDRFDLRDDVARNARVGQRRQRHLDALLKSQRLCARADRVRRRMDQIGRMQVLAHLATVPIQAPGSSPQGEVANKSSIRRRTAPNESVHSGKKSTRPIEIEGSVARIQFTEATCGFVLARIALLARTGAGLGMMLCDNQPSSPPIPLSSCVVAAAPSLSPLPLPSPCPRTPSSPSITTFFSST